MQGHKIFVIEHCENCATHQWNTRHNEALYKQHAMGGKFAIAQKDIEVVSKTF